MGRAKRDMMMLSEDELKNWAEELGCFGKDQNELLDRIWEHILQAELGALAQRTDENVARAATFLIFEKVLRIKSADEIDKNEVCHTKIVKGLECSTVKIPCTLVLTECNESDEESHKLLASFRILGKSIDDIHVETIENKSVKLSNMTNKELCGLLRMMGHQGNKIVKWNKERLWQKISTLLSESIEKRKNVEHLEKIQVASDTFIGVSLDILLNEWVAHRHSTKEDHRFITGTYQDEETAAFASDCLARKLIANGEKGHKLNFPDVLSESQNESKKTAENSKEKLEKLE